MKQPILFAVLVLAACKGKDATEVAQSSSIQPSTAEKTPDEASGTTGEAAGARPSGPAPDWSAEKRTATDHTVDGINVTLEIPNGLPYDERAGDWDSSDPALAAHPKVYLATIERRRVTTAEKAKYFATLDARSQTWVRADEREDGWALTMAPEDKHRIEAIRYAAAGDDTFIKCKAVQAVETGTLPSYAKTRAMLEGICDSLQVRGIEEAQK